MSYLVAWLGVSAVQPFAIEVPDGDLDDLAQPLGRARWPERLLPAGGEDLARLEWVGGLLRRWRDGFDWREVERTLNGIPQLRVTLDGVGVPVVHACGRGPRPLPLLLVTGWPSTFGEYVDALPMLCDPAAHGSAAEDAFEVVIATRPGYGFSDRAPDRAPDDRADGELLGRVMTEALGFQRYVAHGDDFGGTLVSTLALDPAPSALAAIHVTEWLEAPGVDPGKLTAAEAAYLEARDRWREAERAYGHVQATRPQILGLALDDTPLGLLAWIADEFASWSDPDGPGVSDDLVLATAAFYWQTRTITTSMRPYAGAGPPPDPERRVLLPATVAAPREAHPAPPRSWLGACTPTCAGPSGSPAAGTSGRRRTSPASRPACATPSGPSASARPTPRPR